MARVIDLNALHDVSMRIFNNAAVKPNIRIKTDTMIYTNLMEVLCNISEQEKNHGPFPVHLEWKGEMQQIEWSVVSITSTFRFAKAFAVI